MAAENQGGILAQGWPGPSRRMLCSPYEVFMGTAVMRMLIPQGVLGFATHTIPSPRLSPWVTEIPSTVAVSPFTDEE